MYNVYETIGKLQGFNSTRVNMSTTLGSEIYKTDKLSELPIKFLNLQVYGVLINFYNGETVIELIVYVDEQHHE
jgi:hypothetical protein